jgi:RNA polymerase sigma factor (sigma-70 family)
MTETSAWLQTLRNLARKLRAELGHSEPEPDFRSDFLLILDDGPHCEATAQELSVRHNTAEKWLTVTDKLLSLWPLTNPIAPWPEFTREELALIVIAAPCGILANRAFAQLQDLCVRNARARIVAMLGPYGDAEEVLQTVWVKLWYSGFLRREYDPLRPFMPFFATLLRLKVIDHLRKMARDGRYNTILPDNPESSDNVVANAIDPRAGLRATVIRLMVDEILEKLAPDEASVLRHLWFGDKAGDIARKVNQPIEAVYVLIRRAKRNFRRLWDEL